MNDDVPLTEAAAEDLRDLLNALFKECVEAKDQESLKVTLEWFPTPQIEKIKKIETLVKEWNGEYKFGG